MRDVLFGGIATRAARTSRQPRHLSPALALGHGVLPTDQVRVAELQLLQAGPAREAEHLGDAVAPAGRRTGAAIVVAQPHRFADHREQQAHRRAHEIATARRATARRARRARPPREPLRDGWAKSSAAACRVDGSWKSHSELCHLTGQSWIARHGELGQAWGGGTASCARG
jgi:hypothetical protein